MHGVTSVGMYHVLLRVSALTLALMLLFDSGILSPVTRTLSQDTQKYLANVVSVGAAVEPTALNTRTAEISAWERELDAREAALSERELAIGLSAGESGADSRSTYILSIVLFILTVLIVLNYTLDFARVRYGVRSPISRKSTV